MGSDFKHGAIRNFVPHCEWLKFGEQGGIRFHHPIRFGILGIRKTDVAVNW